MYYATHAFNAPATFQFSDWTDCLDFSRRVYATHQAPVYFFKDNEQDAVVTRDGIVDSFLNHVCVLQETPDGYGCVTCLYC